jgi:hypothetical protein
MDIIGEMHDFDFVALIQRQPELVFAEQRFCFHCLFACVADCLYRLHVCYRTLAVRATQVKPIPPHCQKAERPAYAIAFSASRQMLGPDCRLIRSCSESEGLLWELAPLSPLACVVALSETYPLPAIVCLDTSPGIGYNSSHEIIRSQSFGRQNRGN